MLSLLQGFGVCEGRPENSQPLSRHQEPFATVMLSGRSSYAGTERAYREEKKPVLVFRILKMTFCDLESVFSTITRSPFL